MTTVEKLPEMISSGKLLGILVACVKYGPTVILGFAGLFTWYAYYVYHIWEIHFGRKRVSRRQFASPSNREPPDVKTFKHNRENILKAAEKHPDNYATCELLHPLQKNATQEQKKTAIELGRKKSKRTYSMTPIISKNPLLDISNLNDGGKGSENGGKGSLSEQKAEELDMDHVYLTYTEFLWAYCFIGPNAFFLWVKGVTILWIRMNLEKMGIINCKPFDAAEIVGRLCLEGTLAVHYYSRTDNDSELGDIAGFFFHDFPYIDENCIARSFDLLAVDIDIKTKRMVKAKVDDEVLTASQALILLWFNTISGNHVKLHALANWGINNEPEVKSVNPFLAQNSLVTVIYNFFGFSCFAHYIPTWVNWGLMSPNWDEMALIKVFQHGVKDNIWAHPNIEELVPCSRFIRFIVKTRAMFLSEFAKYKDEFPGVHGEAMFVGTVLHSLDHTSMDWNLEDPLWLDVTDEKFGLMAELGRIVKVGFVKDVPGLMFEKRYKGSDHPFYKTVYAKAAKIDKEYADNMDTCIIK